MIEIVIIIFRKTLYNYYLKKQTHSINRRHWNICIIFFHLKFLNSDPILSFFKYHFQLFLSSNSKNFPLNEHDGWSLGWFQHFLPGQNLKQFAQPLPRTFLLALKSAYLLKYLCFTWRSFFLGKVGSLLWLLYHSSDTILLRTADLGKDESLSG